MSAEQLIFVQQTLSSKYKHKKEAQKQVMEVLASYLSLQVSCQHHERTKSKLLTIWGTIPMEFRGCTYNIPICMWLKHPFPASAPVVYVTPTSDMRVAPEKCPYVDAKGLVQCPDLQHWKKTSSLETLINTLRFLFGLYCPVFSKQTQPALQQAQSPPFNPSYANIIGSPQGAVQSTQPPFNPTYVSQMGYSQGGVQSQSPYNPAMNAMRSLQGAVQSQLPYNPIMNAMQSLQGAAQPSQPQVVIIQYPGGKKDASQYQNHQQMHRSQTFDQPNQQPQQYRQQHQMHRSNTFDQPENEYQDLSYVELIEPNEYDDIEGVSFEQMMTSWNTPADDDEDNEYLQPVDPYTNKSRAQSSSTPPGHSKHSDQGQTTWPLRRTHGGALPPIPSPSKSQASPLSPPPPYPGGMGVGNDGFNSLTTPRSLGRSKSRKANRVPTCPPEKLEDMAKALQKMRLVNSCPVCLEAEKKIVFKCGHGVCESCSDPVKFCPVCMRKVKQKIKLT